MLMPPTTTISIERPTATDVDAYGDELDNQRAPLCSGIPAIINYQVSTVRDPATSTPVQVDAAEVFVNRGTDVQDQDVITDQQTGEQYTVTQVRTLPSYGIPADLWLAVKRINGTGT